MTGSNEKSKISTEPTFDPMLYASILHIGLSYIRKVNYNHDKWLAMMTSEFEMRGFGEILKTYVGSVWVTIHEWISCINSARYDKEVVIDLSLKIYALLSQKMVKSFIDVVKFFIEFPDSEEEARYIYRNQDLIRFMYAGIEQYFKEHTKIENGSEKTLVAKEKTMKKTDSRKKTLSRKAAPPKTEELPVQEIPSPVKIVYQKDMGLINLSDSKGILVSLIRNALEQKFLAIQRVSKGKNGSWKADGGKVWLPFGKMKDVVELIAYAYDEGVKAGWDNDYEPQPMNIQQGNIINFATEKPALRELELRSEDPSIYQVALFRDDKKQ